MMRLALPHMRSLLPWVACLVCIACAAARRVDVDGGGGGDAGDRRAAKDAGRDARTTDARQPDPLQGLDATTPPPAPVIRSRGTAKTGQGETRPPAPPPPCPEPPGEDLATLDAMLTAPANDASMVLSSLGQTVALDRDTLALSAVREDDTGKSAVVLVYTRNDDAWVLRATLQPPANEVDSAFGASLALDGDLLAVGTPTLASGGAGDMGNGRVHVFVRDVGTWRLEQTLVATLPVNSDAFGEHVALDGTTLAVAMHQQLGVSIELFTRSDAGWQRTQALMPTGPAIADTPLFNVVLDGDTLAFGARQGAKDLRQAVHIFERSNGTWAPAVTLFGDNPEELFGAALALQGDTLVVGDPQQGVDAPTAIEPAGAVYVFQRDMDGQWLQDGFLKASYPATGPGFGTSVAIDCDRIVVGNPADAAHASGIDGDVGVSTSADEDSGAVYAFSRTEPGADAGPDYELRDLIKSTVPGRQKGFGQRVAASVRRVLVATQGEEAIYVFR